MEGMYCTGECVLGQMLDKFVSMFLNPEATLQQLYGQQGPSDRNMAEEIYNILAFPWKYRVPTSEDCENILKYFNVTCEIVNLFHEGHAEQESISNPFEEQIVAVTFGQIPPIITSYEKNIFKCSMCYEIFVTMYINICLPIDDNEPNLVSSADNETNVEAVLADFNSMSSPIPNIPNSSYEYILNCNAYPLYLDYNRPSNSTYFSFSEAAQVLAVEIDPSDSNHSIYPVRI